MSHRRAAVMVVALLAVACAPRGRPVPVTVVPGASIPLGALYDDVLAMLGPPPQGPRHDRYSNLTEVVYQYPFPAIHTEGRMPGGAKRVETVDRIHLFFDQRGVLARIGHRTNPYYPTFTDRPVDRVTVVPRLVDVEGRVAPATGSAVMPAGQ